MMLRPQALESDSLGLCPSSITNSLDNFRQSPYLSIASGSSLQEMRILPTCLRITVEILWDAACKAWTSMPGTYICQGFLRLRSHFVGGSYIVSTKQVSWHKDKTCVSCLRMMEVYYKDPWRFQAEQESVSEVSVSYANTLDSVSPHMQAFRSTPQSLYLLYRLETWVSTLLSSSFTLHSHSPQWVFPWVVSLPSVIGTLYWTNSLQPLQDQLNFLPSGWDPAPVLCSRAKTGCGSPTEGNSPWQKQEQNKIAIAGCPDPIVALRLLCQLGANFYLQIKSFIVWNT